ncbi:MAG: ATP-binding protein, partial [Magnetococcales bacterium]|nr:ATP-binding protein [Magnetococcales bacterium]
GARIDEAASGTGLGIVLAREIVEAYDGELHFDHSPELQGVRANIQLPDRNPGPSVT